MKPKHIILAACLPLRHPRYVYELDQVEPGATCEWCDEEEGKPLLEKRKQEMPDHDIILRYMAD